MSLSTAAQKLLKYLGIYKITAAEYNRRISGNYDNDYNHNWFESDFSSAQGIYPRHPASPQHGVFQSSLSELITAGY